MKLAYEEIEKAQKKICERFATDFVASPLNAITGIATFTKGPQLVNGLRHAPSEDSSGWYIWFGGQFSEAPDFFEPRHTLHLYEEYPELGKLLGLAPGHRFLSVGEYLDVWYDKTLLMI